MGWPLAILCVALLTLSPKIPCREPLVLLGPKDHLRRLQEHNPQDPPRTPRKRYFRGRTFLLYRKSSSLPLPLLEGITVIGYWTRSSLARARLSIGDRFTPEKLLLDGQLHRHTNYFTARYQILLYCAPHHQHLHSTELHCRY